RRELDLHLRLPHHAGRGAERRPPDGARPRLRDRGGAARRGGGLMVRINRVYTKTGDDGTTGLVGGARVPKDSARIEAYGTVDELNAHIGVVRAALGTSAAQERLDPILVRVQNELFNLGADLATPDEERRRKQPGVAARHVEALEREIDELN